MNDTRTIIAINFFVLLAVLISCIAFRSSMDSVEWEQEIYCVESGDTLWAVGSRCCPDSVDVREWIEEVKKLNELSDSGIYAGQKLTILVSRAG